MSMHAWLLGSLLAGIIRDFRQSCAIYQHTEEREMDESRTQQLLCEIDRLKQDNEKLWKTIQIQKETMDKMWRVLRSPTKFGGS